MEKFSPVWTKVVCFGFMLLKIELTNGAVNIPSTGTPYIGNSFKLECHITPFTGTANWVKDGTTQTTCGTTFCAPATLGNYTFSYDGTGISVTIDPVSTSDGGSWQCTHTSGIDSITLTPTIQSKSEESSSVGPLTIFGGVVGGVVGVGAVSSLAVGGSKLLKKQASDKKDRTVVPGADDVEGGNAVADSSADKPDTNGRTVVADADDAKGGGAAAAESSTVKSDKDASNVEQKDNHTDDMKHIEKPNDSIYNFGVGERNLPPNPQIRQIQQGKLDPITPKKGKKTAKKIDGEEKTNN